MMEWLSSLGEWSIASLWIPLGIWTLVAIPLAVLSRYAGSRHAALHYHSAMALLASLPLGFLLMPFLAANVALIDVPDGLVLGSEAPVEVVPRTTETASAKDPFIFDPTGIEQPLAVPPVAQPMANERATLLVVAGAITVFAGSLSLIGLLLLVGRTYTLYRLRALLGPVQDVKALALVERLRDRFGVRRPVALLLVSDDLGPLTFGVFRPVIGIPPHTLKEPEVLESVLYHEFIHVKRFDYLTGWLTRCIRALFVFHPVVVYLAEQVDTYRELSCDAVFLEKANLSPAAYARLLFRFSTRTQTQGAIPMVQKSSTLKKRIKHMSKNVNFTPMSTRLVGTAVLLFVLLPALLVACSSGAGPAQVDQVAQLEAEVAYLRGEIDATSELMNELNRARDEANEGLTYNDENYDFTFSREVGHQNHRILLLREMLLQSMRELEEARMNVATASLLE